MFSTRFYCIQAPGVPTFYLDARVQGIISTDHAARIAQEVAPGASCVFSEAYVPATAVDALLAACLAALDMCNTMTSEDWRSGADAPVRRQLAAAIEAAKDAQVEAVRQD